MNPVSLLIAPKASTQGGAGRSQAQREDQAAFSPALMMLLAAGLAPLPQSPAPTVGPDAHAAANSQEGEQPLDGAAMNLGANTDYPAPQMNAQPVPRGTSAALSLPEFKAVAPVPVSVANSPGLTTPSNPANPALAGGALNTPVTDAPSPLATAHLDATPARLDLASSSGTAVHVESSDIAAHPAGAGTQNVNPASELPPTAISNAATPGAHTNAPDTARSGGSDLPAQVQVPSNALAAAVLAQSRREGVTTPTSSTVAPSALTIAAGADGSPPIAEPSASGETVLDAARRAAAVANHPTQKLKRAVATLKQAVAPATAEPAVLSTANKVVPGRQVPATGDAPVQQAPAVLPGIPLAPREPAAELVSHEGFTARSTQGVPNDPRLDSIDAGRNTISRPDQVTLRVEGEAGEEARLRIAVRGRDVRATIVTDDPSMARRLEDSIGTLRNALGDRGFERSQLQVQAAPVKAGQSPQDTPRDPQTKQRQQDADSPTKHGKQSSTPEQRSRSRNGRNGEER